MTADMWLLRRLSLRQQQGKGILLSSDEVELVQAWIEELDELRFRMDGLEK